MNTILSELDKKTLVDVFEGYDSRLMDVEKEYREVNQDGKFNKVLENIENKRGLAKLLFSRLYKNKE